MEHKFSLEQFYESVATDVASNKYICVAVDNQLNYIALNDVACTYLKIKKEDLLGKNAIGVFPEITASENHRNMLKALSGKHIHDALIESRMGDIIRTSYTPKIFENEVKALVLTGLLPLKSKG